MKKLPVPEARVLRFNTNIRPSLIHSNFENLNIYNLNGFTSELDAGQMEKLLNYICGLSELPQFKDIDIILCYANDANKISLQNNLADRLNSYDEVGCLNLQAETFLGYKYYLNRTENSLEIILE
jgi:hypothetical protein